MKRNRTTATKILSLGLSLFLLLGALAGCSGSGSSPSPSGSTSAQASTSSTTTASASTSPSASTSATTPAKTTGGTITIGQTSDVLSFDPHDQSDMGSMTPIRHIYSTVTFVTQDNQVVPGLADWTVVDNVTVDFNIKPNVKFHNGEILSAEDIKFSLDRQKNYRQSTQVDTIESVEVLDDLKVRVHLKEPAVAVLLSSLGHFGSAILNKKNVEEAEAAGKTASDVPVGTGPYKFVSFKSYDRCVLQKFDDYFGDAPVNDELVIKIIPDGSARTIALETGEIDFLVNVDTVDATRIAENKNLNLITHESTWMEFIVLNNQKAPFDNKLVRQAISHLVAREAIIKVSENGMADPLYSPVASGAAGYSPDVPHYDYDVEKAKSLLAEAGYPQGFETTVYLFADNRSRTAQVLQASFEEAGIKLNIEVMERGAFYDFTAAGEHQMALSGWISSGDPNMTFSPLYASTSPGVSGNRFFYKSAAYDEVLLKAKQETDPAKRADLYKQCQQIIIEDAGMIPLYTLAGLVGTKANLKGTVVYANGMHRYENMYLEQ